MEDITNITAEQTTDQSDAFLDAWNDSTEVEQAEDQPTEQTEETKGEAEAQNAEAAPDTNGENKEAAPNTTENAPVENAAGEQTKTEEASWNIKHMGEEKTLKASDVTADLLQKGLDYDRVRAKYDEAKPVVEMFSEFAKKAGMSVTDYAKYIREEAKKASGMSETDAKHAVELEDREAAIAAKEAEQREAEEAKESSAAKVQEDIAEFSKAFPDIYKQARDDPKTIPESVWADVKSGKLSLTAAYSKYAVEQANAALKAATERANAVQKNGRNAARSTGSMQSAGNDSKMDDFLKEFTS